MILSFGTEIARFLMSRAFFMPIIALFLTANLRKTNSIIMKKLHFLLALLFVGTATMAQGPKTSTAIIELRKDNWLEAKELIDGAYEQMKEADAEGKEVSEKIASKFWYHRALIYQRMSVSNDPQFAEYKEAALGEAATALENLFIVDVKERWTKEGKELYAFVVNGYLNRAFDKIDAEQYLSAKDDFERAYELKKNPIIGETDTTTLYNAALMANYGKDYDEAIRLNRMLIDMDYQGAQTYLYLAQIYKDMEDMDGYIAVIQEAREKYPSNGDLLIEEANYYIGIGDDEKATETLSLAVEANPENALLWNALGTIQLKLGNEDEAMKALTEAIAQDDSLAEAHYSLGVIWVEKANDMVEKLNADGVSDKEYKALKAEQKGYFEKSLPYFEKALELVPEDALTLDALKVVYYKLDMTDKSMEMKKRLDALQTGG